MGAFIFSASLIISFWWVFPSMGPTTISGCIAFDKIGEWELNSDFRWLLSFNKGEFISVTFSGISGSSNGKFKWTGPEGMAISSPTAFWIALNNFSLCIYNYPNSWFIIFYGSGLTNKFINDNITSFISYNISQFAFFSEFYIKSVYFFL